MTKQSRNRRKERRAEIRRMIIYARILAGVIPWPEIKIIKSEDLERFKIRHEYLIP